MKRVATVAAIVIALMLCTQAKAEDTNWEHTKGKNGIESYSRKVEGSPIKEYRAVMAMDHPIEVLLEVLIDVPSYPKWMPDCLEANILKEFKKGLERGNYYIYLKMHGMGPAENRDLVIESIPKTDWEAGVSVIRLKKLDDSIVPVQKNFVRIAEFVSEFKLERIAREKTLVTFTTYVDAGGSIPPFLAALQTADVPYGTLMGLSHMASDTKYYKAAARDYF
jgi:hypothetical protein